MLVRRLLLPFAAIVFALLYAALAEDTQVVARNEQPPAIQVASVNTVSSPLDTAEQPAALANPATSTALAPAATSNHAATPTPVRAQPQQETLRDEAHNIVERIATPYQTPPLSGSILNSTARQALVNILCQPRAGGSLRPISGSGVIIDPRGVILTNAHVAQYVLLSEDPSIDLSCTIRTGSPAYPTWTAAVLYIPPAWVRAHVAELNEEHPRGTGEYDYALLYILGNVNDSGRPTSFPALSADTRHLIGFSGDSVILAAYPAEFAGGITVQKDLYAASAFTTIKQLLTIGGETVDELSLGGTITAQSGSSGGAVVNEWGRLIGLIVTTSAGATTAERNLNALTLYYIDQNLMAQTGKDLASFLAGDLRQKLDEFDTTAASLIDLYLEQLRR